MESSKEVVRQFIIENFLLGNSDALEDETSFLDEGIIDSTGVLELVTFLENTFSIGIDDDELLPENLDSIKKIVTFVDNKKVQQTAA